MKRYASRKFALCLLVILLATGLLVAGMIDGDVWYKAVGLSLATYAAANVVQGFVPPPPPQSGTTVSVTG